MKEASMKVILTEPGIAGSYDVVEHRDDGTLVLRPETGDEVIEHFADRVLTEEEMLESLDRLHAAKLQRRAVGDADIRAVAAVLSRVRSAERGTADAFHASGRTARRGAADQPAGLPGRSAGQAGAGNGGDLGADMGALTGVPPSATATSRFPVIRTSSGTESGTTRSST
jgi:hypothetical protein